jgi:hypothetical protein
VKSIPILDSNFTLSNQDDFDHLNIKSKFMPKGAGLIGRLPSIEGFHFIIYSYEKDFRLYILEVYNSAGQKVNERQLANFNYCTLNQLIEDDHEIKISSDKTKIYINTTCAISFSAFDHDSVVVEDLIRH